VTPLTVGRLIGSFHYVSSAAPPFPGKLRLVDALGKICGRIGDGRASFSAWPGESFDVDLHDRCQRQMWAGCYEPHVRKCLESLLRKGDVFLDIGAHIGYVAALGARLVGAQGMVFAFEADPLLYETMARNVAPMPWIQALHYAVWKESRELVFERSSFEGESGWGTLTSVRDLGRGEHIEVDALSIDDWAPRFAVDRIRMIKIDAEGSEVDILRGARQTITRFRPVLVVEMNDIVLRQAGASAAELAAALVRENYTLFGLTWMRLEPFHNGHPPLVSEALCIPSERAEAEVEGLRRAGLKLC